MKKKLIRATALAALLSASAVFAGGPEMVIMAPSPFDGFYIGGDVSFHQTGFDIDGDATFFNQFVLGTPTFLLATQSGGDSTTDAYYGVRGGWGKVIMNRWYAGVEGFADFGNADGSITNTLFPGQILSATLSNSGHIGSQYGVAARLGILLSPTTLGYAKLGAVWGDVKASVSGNAVAPALVILPVNFTLADNSSSDTETSFLWGFGVEQFIYRDVISLYAEYTYANFGSVSTSDVLSIFTSPITGQTVGVGFDSSSDASVSAFTGGLNFHFGRNWF